MTLETCCKCGEPTGRAGRFDDSLYAGEFGPYCEDCWFDVPEMLTDEISRLRQSLEHLRHYVMPPAATAIITAALNTQRREPS